MTKTLPPLPDHILTPLPPRLRWRQVVDIFLFWQVGDKRYLRTLVESEIIKTYRIRRSHRRLYDTEDVLKVYPSG